MNKLNTYVVRLQVINCEPKSTYIQVKQSRLWIRIWSDLRLKFAYVINQNRPRYIGWVNRFQWFQNRYVIRKFDVFVFRKHFFLVSILKIACDGLNKRFAIKNASHFITLEFFVAITELLSWNFVELLCMYARLAVTLHFARILQASPKFFFQ